MGYVATASLSYLHRFLKFITFLTELYCVSFYICREFILLIKRSGSDTEFTEEIHFSKVAEHKIEKAKLPPVTLTKNTS